MTVWMPEPRPDGQRDDYENTTRVQLVRAVGIWVLGFGLAGVPLVAGNLRSWGTIGPFFGGLAVVGVGVGMILWARWRLRALDARNRPFLMGRDGGTILPARIAYLARLTLLKRIFLGAMVLGGFWFIHLVSAYNCQDEGIGYCSWVSPPADSTLIATQMFTIITGLVYVTLVVLSRTHDAETERLEGIIAEGDRRRADDDPLGSLGRGWE